MKAKFALQETMKSLIMNYLLMSVAKSQLQCGNFSPSLQKILCFQLMPPPKQCRQHLPQLKFGALKKGVMDW